MAQATLDFFYEFASPYSYLSAARIGPLAEEAGVHVRWKPFLLGPIFAAQGHTTSPFNAYPLKGRYMWRDLERMVERYGLPPVRRPEAFPINALAAARVATWLNDASRPAFTVAAFKAEFAQGRDITDRTVLAQLLAGLGHFCEDLCAEAESPAVKDRLRAVTEEARAAGIFGAPSFVTADGDLFWGNDRLEEALEHAARLAHDRLAPAK